MTRLLARLRAFWRRREIRETVNEEIRFHVEMESAAHRARGLSPSEAARQAAIDLGGPNHVRDAVLDVRTSPLRRLVDALTQDVRYGLRTFSRTPLAIASVVIVLGVGIGLSSAVFGAIDAVFFRALPVPRPDQMAYVTGPTGALDFVVFADRARGAIQGLSPIWPIHNVDVTGDNLHVRADGEQVATDYFAVLQLKPELGRLFEPGDADPTTTDRAVVISDDLWRHRLGADPAVIGQRIRIEEPSSGSHTIVGVAPAGFRGVSLPWMPTQFWTVQAPPVGVTLKHPLTASPALIARLVPGASNGSLSASVANRPGQATAQTTLTDYVVRPAVGLLTPETQASSLGFVRALADAVAMMALAVMLIAASNVVGILMARGVARSTELAVRRALGAGARRLVQQLLTESVLIGAAAGLAGLFVAWVLMHVYRAWSPYDVALDVTIDTRVLAYTLLVCVGAGILVGIAPARQALRVNVLAGLGAPGAGTTARLRRGTRYGSVVPQMALSVGLLVIAGAHAVALAKVERQDPGYQIDDIVAVQASPPFRYFAKPMTKETAEAINRGYFTQALERLRTLPGVSAAALTVALPTASSGFPKRQWTSRDSSGQGITVLAPPNAMVSADFFTVFRIPLLTGRSFDDERDGATGVKVAIVSASLARKLTPGGAALGLRIAVDPTGTARTEPEWREIVGVVGDTFDGSEAIPLVYVPLKSSSVGTLVARTSADPASITPVISRTLTAIDDRAQIGEVLTLSESIARAHYLRRLTLAMLAIAGLVGIVLAAIGLYSAVSYWVAQQARDLGVRATLGATRGDLVRLVLRDGITTVVIACLPGIALGLVGFRLTAGLVRFVVGPIASPAISVVAAVVGLVLLIALAACYLPGCRAAKADPLVALRQA